MTHSWQSGAPANKNRKICVKKDNKTILLREIANQKREIGRLGLFCYISGRSHDKSGDLAALRTGGVVPIMNQYDTCQLVQKWFLVCWVMTQRCHVTVMDMVQ